MPTTTALAKETLDSLTQRLEGCLEALVKKGFSRDLLLERTILTPSCGAGSLSPEEATRVFTLLRQLRDRFKQG